MRSALIHGVLLAVMLVYGYRTWTRDKSVKPDLGSVELWSKSESDLASIEFKSEKKTVHLDHRKDGKDDYWWGTETTVEKKPKPKPPEPKPAPAGSGSDATGSGSAGSGSAGSGSAAKPAAGSGSAGSGSAGSGSAGSGSGSATPPKPPPVEMVETTKKREFPLGDNGEKVIKAFTEAHAVDDLGTPSADQLVNYKLADKAQVEAKLAEVKKELDAIKAEDEKEKAEEKEAEKNGDKSKKKPKQADKKPELQKRIKELEDQKKSVDGKERTMLTVTFSDGSKREFYVGGSVYGGTDRYVMDKATGTAYVLSKDMVSSLEIGESTLQLTDPRGFDATKIEEVEVDWNGRKKVAKRTQTGVDERQVKTWLEEPTGKPNQPLATFIDNINNLRPTEYVMDLKLDNTPPIVRLEYRDDKGATLGSLALYKVEKPPVIPEGTDFDPANPPKGETEYYVLTERTRVPALVRKDPAHKSEEDLPIVYGDKAAPVAPPKPGANPFGNVPIKKPQPAGANNPFGNVPIPPHPGGAAPHPGSAAAPHPTGSATPAPAPKLPKARIAPAGSGKP